MLTLQEALQIPILAEAKLVAGAGGVQGAIRWVHSWVHTVNVPDVAEWLHGGELLLTTFSNMPETPAAQRKFLRQLAEKGIVGLVITTGKLLEEIPDYLREIADELTLPLIELPYQVRFVDIAKIINERISQEQLDRVSRALSIQQRLSRLVLEGGGFQELAEMLADLVKHSISIENDQFEAIANKNIAEVDSARRYTIEHGRTDPQLIAALEVEYLPKIRDSLQPMQLPVMPELGLEMERLLAPIVVHGEIYGYMWIIADVHALSPIDRMAIEAGATVAALLTLYQESRQSAEASLKGSLIAQLIEGNGERQTILSDQSLRYGVDLRQPYHMLLVSISNEGVLTTPRAYRAINQILTQGASRAVAAQFAGQVVILAQATEDIDLLAGILSRRLGDDAGGVLIGISSAYSGADQVGAAHQQCNEVLDIARRLNSGQAVHHFDDLGYIHTLYHAGKNSLERNPQVPILRKLLAERQADLFNTLETYLDTGGNSVETAVTLHVHRSTVNYRLTRIKEICDIDLSSPGVRLNLQVALKLMRLFDDLGSG